MSTIGNTLLNHITRTRWLFYSLLLVAGAVTPLSFSPYDYWWVALASIAIFALLITQRTSGKQFFLAALTFGLGYFGTGVSWVYVSIYYFSHTPFILAIFLTTLFVSFIALVFALPFYLLRYINPSKRLLVGIPVIWVFSEWIRTWLLTGFPWLFIGYVHIDTWIIGWAPIGGVLLLSLLSVASSVIMANILKGPTAKTPWLCLVMIWSGGYVLQTTEWTQPTDENEITIGIVQPNIPQEKRWEPEYQDIIKDRLHTLSEPLWDTSDWIIWPEGSLPHLYHRSLDFIDKTRIIAKKFNTTVISGALYDEPLTQHTEKSPSPQRPRYFNSIIGIGESEGFYHKQRLVPFGEYVPLEDWLRGVINFFDLPFSVISSGAPEQKNMIVSGYTLANAICYEIAYPALVAKQSRDAHVLLTVSNDSWFGDSIGPMQHFQMVRMRAVETGRYIIRGTNNGVSAIILPNGSIQKQSPQFVMTTLEGTVKPMMGNTPFMEWNNYLLLILLAGLGIYGMTKRYT